MINYGKVRSTVRPEQKVIDEYSVWVNTDVEVVAVSDEEDERVEYEYTQTRYTKDEYIKLMDDKNTQLEEQLTDTQIALCDVYEMIGGE